MNAGFSNTAHLTRTLRAAFGTTPTLATATAEWRSECRG